MKLCDSEREQKREMDWLRWAAGYGGKADVGAGAVVQESSATPILVPAVAEARPDWTKALSGGCPVRPLCTSTLPYSCMLAVACSALFATLLSYISPDCGCDIRG